MLLLCVLFRSKGNFQIKKKKDTMALFLSCLSSVGNIADITAPHNNNNIEYFLMNSMMQKRVQCAIGGS